jgi:ankyrin repeat protein
MKKYLFIFALLLCAASLFGQDLFSIAEKGTPEQIQAAIKAGADVHARDKDGKTALMWAAGYNENPDVITTLLKAGANGKLKSSEGKTAFDYAKDNPKIKGTTAYWALNDARF